MSITLRVNLNCAAAWSGSISDTSGNGAGHALVVQARARGGIEPLNDTMREEGEVGSGEERHGPKARSACSQAGQEHEPEADREREREREKQRGRGGRERESARARE